MKKLPELITQTRFLEVGSGAINRATDVFSVAFENSKALIVCDEFTYNFVGKKLENLFDTANISRADSYVFKDARLFTDYKYVEALRDRLSQEKDLIAVALGAGTVNDITKLASYELGRPYMCIVTAASVDGYTAFGASIVKNGTRSSVDCSAPKAVICDSDIISKAPLHLTAAGYADLSAKITAGADWILADALGIEKIDAIAWATSQDCLPEALGNPEGIVVGEASAMDSFLEGLMQCGFAMQIYRSSRPASGGEHLLAHLWDMENLEVQGRPVSHGFAVSVGTLAMTILYEKFLKIDFSSMDYKMLSARRKTLAQMYADADQMFAGRDFLESAKSAIQKKYEPQDVFENRIKLLCQNWNSIKSKLQSQLVDSNTLRARLEKVKAPTSPEQIGLSDSELNASLTKAANIRTRWTLLDLLYCINFLDF